LGDRRKMDCGGREGASDRGIGDPEEAVSGENEETGFEMRKP